ncbi:hypothetical protein VNI00_009577 [Paramarasmius palmivorus]|uniref:Silicon transporter n=1 Tax=Paramarasmius palmivorus TaxID=297713 RepID=A0AAW0CQ61_9AGAR
MDNLSHSDSITKIIAVIQTAWFLLQVGARAVEGLAITELEIITVGFAVLNFGTYFLWWNKPLRVRHPVRVYWRQQVVAERKHEDKRDAKGWIDKIQELVMGVWDSVRDAFVNFGTSMIVLFNFLGNPAGAELNNKALPDMNWVTLLQLAGLPLLVVIRLVIASVLGIISDDNDGHMAFVFNSSRLQDESFTLYILVYGLTTLFGAIHCIPWNFQFPTDREQLLWRVSAGGLVALPLTLLVVMCLIGVMMFTLDAMDRHLDEDSRFHETIGGIGIVGVIGLGFSSFVICVALPFAYFTARVILMVLALMELRSLPSSAYQTVQWATFIPHIG